MNVQYVSIETRRKNLIFVILTTVHPNGSNPIQEPYTYDAHGNITSMVHLQDMKYDFKDQLYYVKKASEKIYYIYDSSRQRVKKIIEKNNGSLIEERIYLGNFEIFRKFNNGDLRFERKSLHVMDKKKRVALIETRTIDLENIEESPYQLIRYQISNHLGSAALELNEEGKIISYEEYHPFGTTSYQGVRENTEVSQKIYRYLGKERNEETGLYYYGARYYAPWLGRWTSCDPVGLADGINVYAYCKNNPVSFVDIKGTTTTLPEEVQGLLNVLQKRYKSYADQIKNTKGIGPAKVGYAADMAIGEDLRALIPGVKFDKRRGRFSKKDVDVFLKGWGIDIEFSLKARKAKHNLFVD